MLETTRIDLLRDWHNLVKDILNKENYNTEELDDDLIGITYFAYLKRIVAPKKRKILKSREFSCPPELYAGLEQLELKISLGSELRPYLSRAVKRASNNDLLLYDWDIHHLHLGSIVEKDGFIQRTGPVVFIRFSEETAYLLNVFKHGNWSNAELIKIIHENWPESIKNCRIKDVIGLSTTISSPERQLLRAHQINSPVEIAPSVVYAGLGMGTSMSGTSNLALFKYVKLREALLEIEAMLKKNPGEYLNRVFENLPVIANPKLTFRLNRNGGGYTITEENNNIVINLEKRKQLQ
ncbi:hypothetical protein [Desertivirga brevis]|uniref:hypothetical protein n=1 Tax=Desertivirga brevis TaxID=2810310 RepID=UPI001A9670D5|nr:hypothetical protein [Pedobacter sp. SYSU D00873]